MPAPRNDIPVVEFPVPGELVRLIFKKKSVWLASTVVCTILALAYALVMPRYWEATQALLVRQEAVGSGSRPGKFADLYEMRTLQETILELAKSRQVVSATIANTSTDLGPDGPTERQIEILRKRMSMLPPKGAEFGKTEVFYLSVKDTDREKAIAMVAELCDQLDARLKEYRDQKADGLIAELRQQAELADAAHTAHTAELEKLETRLGPDLGELRQLNSAVSGQSDLRQQFVSVESESRRVSADVDEAQELLNVLRSMQRDPDQIVAMPNSLITLQPTLRQLKDGLVAAQLRTARLSGTRTAEHPDVVAALDSEQQIRQDLHRELGVAIDGLEVQLRVGRGKLERLDTQLASIEARLAVLASNRAEYSNRVAAVDSSRRVLDDARQKLSEAMAAKAAVQSASLVTKIDHPETGSNPVGARRAVVVAAGMIGGRHARHRLDCADGPRARRGPRRSREVDSQRSPDPCRVLAKPR